MILFISDYKMDSFRVKLNSPNNVFFAGISKISRKDKLTFTKKEKMRTFMLIKLDDALYVRTYNVHYRSQ